ncbi:MAG: hypothetical protein ACI83W_002423, partial [Marinoscillum sp.]
SKVRFLEAKAKCTKVHSFNSNLRPINEEYFPFPNGFRIKKKNPSDVRFGRF